MIVPDVNLLVYAHNEADPHHAAALAWWESLLNGTEQIGLPWSVTAGFVRVITNRSSVTDPVAPAQALDVVEEWFRNPLVRPINPGHEHLTLFRQAIVAAGVGGNLVPDAHIAALAMEYQAEVHSGDSDFGRFPGLRWRNPL